MSLCHKYYFGLKTIEMQIQKSSLLLAPHLLKRKTYICKKCLLLPFSQEGQMLIML